MINNDVMEAIREELCEVETIAELNAMVCDMVADDSNRGYAEHPQMVLWIKGTLTRLRLFPPAIEVQEQVEAVVKVMESAPRLKTHRKYKLLKTDVTWSTKPQVHALMTILSAHAKIGDIIEEEDIIKMMDANVEMLQTRQGGKRIWDYYKGNSNEGLQAHGNVERI